MTTYTYKYETTAKISDIAVLSGRIIRIFLAVFPAQADCKEKDTSFSRGGMYTQFAAQKAEVVPSYGKAHACTAVTPGRPLPHLIETVENKRLFLKRNAYAGIGNIHFQKPLAYRLKIDIHLAAIFVELDSIVYNIPQGLLQQTALNMGNKLFIRLGDINCHILFAGLICIFPCHLLQKLKQIHHLKAH